MLDARLRAHYLSAMDIVEWYSRQIKPAPKIACYQVTFTSKQGTVFLLADANLHEENIAIKEKKLLQAILHALGVKPEIILHENIPHLSVSKIAKLILMGEKVTQSFQSSAELNGDVVIACYSLNQLLLQPLLKIEIWGKIKNLEIDS